MLFIGRLLHLPGCLLLVRIIITNNIERRLLTLFNTIVNKNILKSKFYSNIELYD